MSESYDSYRIKLSSKGSISVTKGKAVVSSVSRYATELGIEVLESGGNAFDAAFAVGLSLTLYHPQAGNIGGGGYLLFYIKGDNIPKAISYREKAPQSIKISSYFDKYGNVNPERSSFGPMSVCTPGTIKAFFYLHKTYGRLSSSEILKKISELSKKGYPITNYQADCLNRLSPKLSFSPESKKIYVKEKGYKAGDILKNPDLAYTFDLLAKNGDKIFYRGDIAKAISDDIRENGGFLSFEDLNSYDIKFVQPIYTEVNDKLIWSVPPEGGGAVLINLFNILNNEKFRSIEYGSNDYYHVVAQALKISFINRYQYLGDVSLSNNRAYINVFDKNYWIKLYNSIDLNTDISRDRWIKEYFPGVYKEFSEIDEGNTTHFSIIDTEGNAVSNSYTLNLRYGSKWSIKDLGFLLNGSIDAFSFKPGQKNYFGIIGNTANLISPGKRPASSMAPVLITDSKGVFGLIGTPGGPTIPSVIFNVVWPFINNSNIGIEEIVNGGRIHHQAWPDVLYIEKNKFSDSFIKEMSEKGYSVKYKDEPIGDIHAIFRNDEDDVYIGVSDYRREGFSYSI